MANPLLELSNQLAATVEAAARSVVAVNAHPRVPASGIHWRKGILVTTEHTLKQQTMAELTLPDGAKQSVKLAGKDAATGIAVFRVELDALPVAEFADASAQRAGNLTLVVGRSARSGVTASMGVISSVSGSWRNWQGGAFDHHIQLDMGLYPGSNGGAVVDTAGRLIGVASSNFSRLGAIAIPASTVNRVLDTLLKSGYVPRGYLGIGMRVVAVPESFREKLLAPSETALIMLSVEAGSAAAKAGLMVGDLLVALDRKPTKDPDDVQDALGPESVGTTVTAHVLRGGSLIEVPVTVGERGLE